VNKPRIAALPALIALLTLSSCSIFLEANRPDYKDTSVIRNGMARSVVIEDLGPPNDSYRDVRNRTVDVYKLDPNGQTVPLKAGITFFHVAADVLTLGLWEFIGYPLEAATQHDLTTYVITYQNERIALVEYGAGAIQPAPSAYSSAFDSTMANQVKAFDKE
jgi:hypothetical protein